MPNDIEKLCQALMASLNNNCVQRNIPSPSSFRIGESFELWKNRLLNYLSTFPEEQHSAITMGLLDDRAYETAVTADICSSLPIKSLLKRLSTLFSPRKLPLEARYMFKRRDQLPEEDCNIFIQELRKLEFAAYPESTSKEREERLLEQFTEGIQDPEIRKSFLTDLPKSLSAAIDRGSQIELVSQAVAPNCLPRRIYSVGGSKKILVNVAVQTNPREPENNEAPSGYFRRSRYQERGRGRWQSRRNFPRRLNEATLHNEEDDLTEQTDR